MSTVFTHVLAEEERLVFFKLRHPGIKVMHVSRFASKGVSVAGATNLNGGPWENRLLLSLLMSDRQ